MQPMGTFPRQKAEAKVVAPEAGKIEAAIHMLQNTLHARHRFPPSFDCG